MTVTFSKQSYATKSTAKRAAKRAGIETYLLEKTEDGRWYYKRPEVGDNAYPQSKENGSAVVDEKSKRERSTVESPCAIVWSLVDEMKGERRKDIIAAAVAKGVHPGTARVQAQKALKAQRT